uniref:Glycosyltransferase family 92 protein n=1 Tax=Strongyloides papillosus TaxID=174720 RepID=A0A0N5BN67_STREA
MILLQKLYLYFILLLFNFTIKFTCQFNNKIEDIKNTKGNEKIRPSEIGVLMINEKDDQYDNYKLAIESVHCYCLHYGYTFKIINFNTSPRLPVLCPQEDFFFARHCAVSLFLETFKDTIKYVIVIDSDIGIINPNHRLEKFISKESIIFTRRLMTHEIAASPYIVKNNEYGRKFLMEWAQYFYKLPPVFHGSDNGALMIMFMMKFYNKKYDERYKMCLMYYATIRNWEDYRKFCVCVNTILKSISKLNFNNDSYIFDNGNVKVLTKKENLVGMVRDIWLSNSSWAPIDFMIHGLKKKTRNNFRASFGYWESPLFNEGFQLSKCNYPNFTTLWEYKSKYITSNEKVISYLENVLILTSNQHTNLEVYLNRNIKNNLIDKNAYFYVRSAFQVQNSPFITILFLANKYDNRIKTFSNIFQFHEYNKEEVNNLTNISSFIAEISEALFIKHFSGVEKIIISNKQNVKESSIAVCSPILQNFNIPGKLLHYFKYWMSFNSNVKFYIYYHSWSKQILDIINVMQQKYENIEVVNWSDLPYNGKENFINPNFEVNFRGQELARADCVLRNKNKAKYVIFSNLNQEFDEINNLDFLSFLSKKYQKASVFKFSLYNQVLTGNSTNTLNTKKDFLKDKNSKLTIFLPERINLPFTQKLRTFHVDPNKIHSRIVDYQYITIVLPHRNTLKNFSVPLTHWDRTPMITPENKWKQI